MPYFKSDNISIAWEHHIPENNKKACPILLLHGFSSNYHINWIHTGWVSHLVNAGYETVILDHRGHGKSDKLYSPSAYSAPIMAQDGVNLLDHLGIKKAHIMGYSMGARIAAFCALNHPQYTHTAILAGLAENMIRGFGDSERLAAALEEDDPTRIVHEKGMRYRLFAEKTNSDRKALAACLRGERVKISPQNLQKLDLPVLVVAGTEDTTAGAIEPLARHIKHAETCAVPDKDHMRTVGDPIYKRAVITFLNKHDPT